MDIYLPKRSVRLLISQQVRLWLTNFPWGQALIKTKYFGIYQNDSFSSLITWSTRLFFLDYCENLVRFPKQKLAKIWGSFITMFPLDFLNYQSCPHWASKNCQLQFRFSYPGIGPRDSFCMWIPVLVRFLLPVFTCLSLQYWERSFTMCLLLYYRSRRVVDFSYCSSFDLFLG